jgi:hypothetical protein
MHRILNTGQKQYLQQITNYLGYGVGGAGRVFPMGTGVIGEAYRKKRVVRTKYYEDQHEFELDLAQSVASANEGKDPQNEPRSNLAIPFGGAGGTIVLILYADSFTFNHFANASVLDDLLGMCCGYANTIDSLQKQPLGLIKNFPLLPADDAQSESTLYSLIQEVLLDTEIPQLKTLSSFNFEAYSD